MEHYWKAVGAVLVASVLGLAVGKRDKDIAVLLSMAVCTMVGVLAISYLEPVLDLFRDLERLAQPQGQMTGILLKAAGTAIVTEIAALTCTDSGNSSLGKTLQMLGSGVILWLSIPVIQAFIALLQEMLYQL